MTVTPGFVVVGQLAAVLLVVVLAVALQVVALVTALGLVAVVLVVLVLAEVLVMARAVMVETAQAPRLLREVRATIL